MKNWDETLFGAFLGILVALAVFIIQRVFTHKKEKLELHNLYLDTIEKMDRVAKEKIQEMEDRATELEEQMKDNAIRYKQNIDGFLLQIQENGKTILGQQQRIEELSKELSEFKKEVSNGNSK